MSNVASTRGTNGGFTLMELLLAIFIFAIVISAVYGSYITTLTAVDATESQAEINNKARITLNRIMADLGSSYFGKGGFLRGQTQKISENRADTLEFTSSAHLVFSKNGLPAGFTVIKYTIQQDPGSKLLQLYRTDIPFIPGYAGQPDDEQTGYLLCDGLRSVRFTYYDQSGNEVDNWQSDEDLGQEGGEKIPIPAMIEARLDFPDQNRQDIVFKTAEAMPALQNPGN